MNCTELHYQIQKFRFVSVSWHINGSPKEKVSPSKRWMGGKVNNHPQMISCHYGKFSNHTVFCCFCYFVGFFIPCIVWKRCMEWIQREIRGHTGTWNISYKYHWLWLLLEHLTQTCSYVGWGCPAGNVCLNIKMLTQGSTLVQLFQSEYELIQ